MPDTDKALQIARDLASVADHLAYAGGPHWSAEVDGPRYEHEAASLVQEYGIDDVGGDDVLRAAVVAELDGYISGQRARVDEERDEIRAIEAGHENDRRRIEEECRVSEADRADQHR